MLPSQKEKICRQKEKTMHFPCQRTRCFLIPNASIIRQKSHLKKKNLFIYLPIYQCARKLEKKYRHSEKLLLLVHPHHRTDFPLQIITSEAVWLFFPSAPPVLITNALLVLPVGQTPHLVRDHQLLNVSEEIYSTDLCQ